MLPPCVIHEDEHLLVVNKPPGWNTHSPAPFAGEGIYDWLRHREPRWGTLAIIHRLDKETSGVLAFGKTPLANRSLTNQFAKRQAHKRYLLLTGAAHDLKPFSAKSHLARIGERYASRPAGELAETNFTPGAVEDLARQGLTVVLPDPGLPLQLWVAEPLTGRTHQIRVQASEHGIPILGDGLYGGQAASRVMLHAAELTLRHPATGEVVCFRASADFSAAPGLLLRNALFDDFETNCVRLAHGQSDGWAGGYLDRLGDYLLYQSEHELDGAVAVRLAQLAGQLPAQAIYCKRLDRQVRRVAAPDASPRLHWGNPAPGPFLVQENGLQYELSFQEGYSVGLFLDQRDNRRRLLTGQVGAGFSRLEMKNLNVLNTFAYTCGFSVAAAKAGAHTTSLDLSKKYLEWGRRNYALNDLDAGSHDFIFGDVFDWLKRFRRKGRKFDLVLLDPPTFSQSRESGVFRADRDYALLIEAALGVLKPQGTLFASNNTATWQAAEFVETVLSAVSRSKRRMVARHYVPQPPDFPISKAEPAHLKTIWLRVE